MLGGFLMVQAYVVARVRKYPREVKRTAAERTRATFVSIPALTIPVIVLGSILGGIATPTEAAVVGVVAVTAAGTLCYRMLTLKGFIGATVNAARTTGSILFIIASAAAFGRILTVYGVAAELVDWVASITTNPVYFLLVMNVVYILLGCFIDTIPILLVVVPLLMPTVDSLGIDPIHFGVVTVFNLLIGLITPPYGLTMFLMCRIANITFVDSGGFVADFLHDDCGADCHDGISAGRAVVAQPRFQLARLRLRPTRRVRSRPAVLQPAARRSGSRLVRFIHASLR